MTAQGDKDEAKHAVRLGMATGGLLGFGHGLHHVHWEIPAFVALAAGYVLLWRFLLAMARLSGASE